MNPGLVGSLDQMYKYQRWLAIGQAVPLVGPLFASPVKALMSTAQLVVGAVSALFFEFKSRQYADEAAHRFAVIGTNHFLMGSVGLIYSLINIRFFGYPALTIEVLFNPLTSNRVCSYLFL